MVHCWQRVLCDDFIGPSPCFILFIFWKKVSKNHSSWKLKILGDGPYFNELKNLPEEELVAQRMDKYAKMGVYKE